MKYSNETVLKSSGDPPNRSRLGRSGGRGAFAGSAEEQPARAKADGNTGAPRSPRLQLPQLGGSGWSRESAHRLEHFGACGSGATWHYFIDGLSLCGKCVLHRPGFHQVDAKQLTIAGELEELRTLEDCGTCGRVLELRRHKRGVLS